MGQMTFSDYIDRWKFEARTNASESWKITQDYLIDSHILPVLSSNNLAEIDAGSISRIFIEMQARGYAQKTKLHVYVLLNSIFTDAAEFFEMSIKNPIKEKYHKPKVPKKEASFMNPTQSVMLLEYVLNHQFGIGVWIQTLSGIRVSELLPLRYSDLDFKNDQISIKRIFNRMTKEIQDYTKNRKQIYVPMPPRLKKFLSEYADKHGDFLMPNANGDMSCYYSYRRYLRSVCEKLKLPIRSPHGLRHSCTELWVEAGASAEDLRRLLNHKSLDSTKNYIHRTDDRLIKISKNIA